ncbi:melanoma receptor tyrosine-protein kinase-like, partial [Menidia menidia]
SIEEVSGYVLIAMNEAATVPLPGLRLIRGQSLYEGRFALLVMSNYNRNHTAGFSAGLRRLQLSNLTEILAGGVKITHNPLLCHTGSIQWNDIVEPGAILRVGNNSYAGQCVGCDSSCVNGSCWDAGPEHCQKLSRLPCAQQCSQRCFGPKPVDCCHEQCAAGCRGPGATDCLACRNFNDGGSCSSACPPAELYDSSSHQAVRNPHAKYAFGASCVQACPRNYVVTDGSCVRSCGPGMFEVETHGVHRCRSCEGPCPKECDGIGVNRLSDAIAVNASNIASFRNCTKIRGSLVLTGASFTGDPHYNIPPMEPEMLEYFRSVKEITGYLLISAWPQNFSSLSVFENLEVIRGRITFSNRLSLVVARLPGLRWLGLRALREVSAGGVLLKENPRLCFGPQWDRLFRSGDQRAQLQGLPDHCESQNRSCGPLCSGGCWGPGDHMCLSCRDFEQRGRCVQVCNLLQGVPREVPVNGTCVSCHPECSPQTGEPSCSGPGPAQCSRCRRAQDGPVCVGRCPQGLLGGGGPVWKYPDSQGRCQACSQNCTRGCSGPRAVGMFRVRGRRG